MGLRSWLNQALGRSENVGTMEAEKPVISEEETTTFLQTQETRASEALALFEEDDPVVEPLPESVSAPYDASQAQLEDLLSDESSPSFTHQDEVEINDVSEVEDPYENATIEGDISETVVFELDENSASV
jgi:hypothetical protein